VVFLATLRASASFHLFPGVEVIHPRLTLLAGQRGDMREVEIETDALD
jgi:hypothetical protein